MSRPPKTFNTSLFRNYPKTRNICDRFIPLHCQVWDSLPNQVYREDGPAKIGIYSGMNEAHLEWWSKTHHLRRCNLNMRLRRRVDA